MNLESASGASAPTDDELPTAARWPASTLTAWERTMTTEMLPRRRERAGKKFTGELSAPFLPRKDDHKKPMIGKRNGKTVVLGQQLTERAYEFRNAFVEMLGARLPSLMESATAKRCKAASRWVIDQAIDRGYLIDGGEWKLELTVYAGRQATSKLGPGKPLIDPDACLTPVLDALQFAGVIDDDMRVREVAVRTEYRAGKPGLRIKLRRLA